MDIPKIHIGGREFPVPHLSLGQLRYVIPALLRLNKGNMLEPTAENIDDLNEIAYLAILRGTPVFSKAEYQSLPGSFDELLAARPIIAVQAGMSFKAGNLIEGEIPAGP